MYIAPHSKHIIAINDNNGYRSEFTYFNTKVTIRTLRIFKAAYLSL